jgi:fatty-acyl-CoA synthase
MSIADPRRQCLGDILRRTAARCPDRPAIVCADTTWTYAELDTICNRVAHGLLTLGLRAGDRVAVLARNSHAFVAVRFAIARCGAVLVPINFMLNSMECAYLLQHSGARILCVDSTTEALGRAAASAVDSVEQIVWIPAEQAASPPQDLPTFAELLAPCIEEPGVDLASTALAQIVYTSGTESQPKGAMLSHEALIAEYVTCLADAQIDCDDRVLHSMPLYHCAQLDAFLGPCVYAGATNIITSRPIPDNVLPLIEAHNVSSFFAPPTVWISLLRSPLFDSMNLSSLRKGYYGASIMPVEVLREICRRLPGVRLWNLYGQTEIAPVATVLKPEDQLRKAGSAGKPALNVETRVVDEEGHSVAPGEVGEVVHRSPQLLLGYYQDPERTRAAFTGGWFHSGDLATIDEEGYITIVDRKKDMIKSGGENVSSREVEEVIYRLQQISEVAVIGLPDPRWIEAVTAVVVVRAGCSLTEQQVTAHCRESLASFKVPKQVIFASLLPKNSSGKLLKRELRALYGHGASQITPISAAESRHG